MHTIGTKKVYVSPVLYCCRTHTVRFRYCCGSVLVLLQYCFVNAQVLCVHVQCRTEYGRGQCFEMLRKVNTSIRVQYTLTVPHRVAHVYRLGRQ